MSKVAFLGLGVMGAPMARHLATKGGHEMTVFNRTFAKAQSWVAAHGGKAAQTPREAAAGQELVFACVGNDDDLRSVTLGDAGAFAGMARGRSLSIAPRLPPKLRASSMPLPKRGGSPSSMRRFPVVRLARKTAC